MRAWIAAAILVFHGGSSWAWNFIEAGSAGTSDGAGAVLIDSAGDVISGGFFQDPAPQIVLIKHSGANGSEIWRFSLPGVADVGGVHLFEDANGDMLAAIHRYGTVDSVVLKLSPDGLELWRVELPGVQIRTADLNSSGGLAVGGRVANGAPYDWDLFVATFAGSGSELWRRTISGGLPTASEEQARAVRFDAAGDVVVGGGLLINAVLGLPDFAVLKLAGADGTELWRAIVPSTAAHGGNAWSVAVDSAGDVVAAGAAVLIDWCDMLVVKFRGTDGSEAWRSVFDEPGDGSRDQLFAVALNHEDDVFTTGAPNNNEFSVLRLSGTSGTQVWRHNLGLGHEGGQALGVRADGSLVAMGRQTVSYGHDRIAITRLDPADGHELFLRTIDTEGCGDGYPAMSLGLEGDIAVAASVFRRIGGECIWPHGYDYGVFKFTGASGLDFWGGCQDERDNDGDGLVDLADPQCSGPSDATENPLGGVLGCGIGPELAMLLPVLRVLRRRRMRAR